MKPTNYHLFDFLDFDPDLSRDEWVSGFSWLVSFLLSV